MGLSRRLFLISLGAADFVTYDQREVFLPTPSVRKMLSYESKTDTIASAGRTGTNRRLFFFHFRGQFCFDLVKNQVFRL